MLEFEKDLLLKLDRREAVAAVEATSDPPRSDVRSGLTDDDEGVAGLQSMLFLCARRVVRTRRIRPVTAMIAAVGMDME